MLSILLVIIYISFISLGLPDAMLGSAWPVMYGEFAVPVSYAGIISMIIAGGTIISSLSSDKVIVKFGTGKVTVISVAMTAIGLFGFSISDSFVKLCLWSIPYGLGAGAIDAALNNFVALHYNAKHMSWLHCFWGLGAMTGPYVMGACLTGGFTWNTGYRSIGILQVILTVLLIFSLPMWKKIQEEGVGDAIEAKSIGLIEMLKICGVKAGLIAFFCYCALESVAGLWASSYMVMYRGISAETAARWAALFYIGITVGRFLSGFITMRLSSKNLIRLGQVIILTGIVLLLLPVGNVVMCIGLVCVGLGCAPIYPCFIHETPNHFGAAVSQSIIGVQMASAYVGSTFMPPVFGFIAEHISIRLYPMFLFCFVLLMVAMSEILNQKTKQE